MINIILHLFVVQNASSKILKVFILFNEDVLEIRHLTDMPPTPWNKYAFIAI